MADVRALLKAKREEKRISHPFAAYGQSGQLRCIACSTVVKYASAWNGHLGSKAHRLNAARVKEEERLKAVQEEEIRLGKRKADDGDDNLSDEEAAKKPRLDNDSEDEQAQSKAPATGLPSDFFSDPSRAITIGDSDGSDVEEGDKNDPPPAVTPQPQTSLDMEWEIFQKSVINAPVEVDPRETYERATIFAEPKLSTEIPEGFPSSIVPEPNVEPQPDAAAVQKDEGEGRRKREEEERELIMDRLLDEERAQEEADERVNTLKSRLDLLRQKRMAAKSTRRKH